MSLRSKPRNRKVLPQERSVERYDRILTVASDLFLQKGYTAVSLDDVVRQAGGSKSNIYSYFGDKKGLFIKVMESLMAQQTELWRQLDLSGLSYEAGLVKLSKAYVLLILNLRSQAIYRLAVAEALAHPDVARLWFESGPANSVNVFADWIQRHHENGNALSREAAEDTAIFLRNMLQYRWLMQAHLGFTTEPTAADIDALVENVLNQFHYGFRIVEKRL